MCSSPTRVDLLTVASINRTGTTTTRRLLTFSFLSLLERALPFRQQHLKVFDPSLKLFRGLCLEKHHAVAYVDFELGALSAVQSELLDPHERHTTHHARA
jgi:hypothetical protein